MDSTLLWIFLLLLCIIVFAIIGIPLIVSKCEEKYNKKLRYQVLNTSTRVSEFQKIIEDMNFFDINQTFTFDTKVNSKAKLDRFDFDSFFKEEIFNNLNWLDNLISKVNHNKDNYPEFNDAFNRIYYSISNDNNKSKNKYTIIENDILLEYRKDVTTSPDFVCVVHYSSPQGRNSYERPKSYSFDELVTFREIVIEEKSNKKTEAYQRKVERNKMSDSLRYDVLKRDNFRCVLCGRSATDGVSLEVDHIKPISKGGKTTMSNLQTLCKTCNRGKSDKFSGENM